MREKVKVKVGKLIKITSGERHAYYESNVGIIRKPLIKSNPHPNEK